MMPGAFVTWKWKPQAKYRSSFGPETVNVLRRMIARQADWPHRFICVTNEPEGIDPEVEIIPSWDDFADLPSPSGQRNPSCYRRLRAFAPDIGKTFGQRFVMVDLDTVITGPLRPLFERSEDFVIWGDTNPRTYYNGGLILMNAGARAKVWTTFHPVNSPREAHRAGHHGSDQGWISHCLGPKEVKWTTADGVYSFKNDVSKLPTLPEKARLVSFHGEYDPWQERVRTQHAWVREHYQ